MLWRIPRSTWDNIILLPDLLLKFLRASAFARPPGPDFLKSPQRTSEADFEPSEIC